MFGELISIVCKLIYEKDCNSIYTALKYEYSDNILLFSKLKFDPFKANPNESNININSVVACMINKTTNTTNCIIHDYENLYYKLNININKFENKIWEEHCVSGIHIMKYQQELNFVFNLM